VRRSLLFWTTLCAAVVVGLFVIKHRVQSLEEKLTALNAEIISDQNAIQVLEAEWAYLNQPARLEELSRRLLGMDAPRPEQTRLLEDFLKEVAPRPEAPAEAGATEVAAAPTPGRRPERKTMPAPVQDEDWLTPIMAKLKKTQ
jgi:cell division protein FtsL